MERHTAEGKGPVDEIEHTPRWHQSSTKHEEFGVKPGGPPPKPKYSPVTDSEIVPGGKGEKNPGRGVKKNLKPCAYKQWER